VTERWQEAARAAFEAVVRDRQRSADAEAVRLAQSAGSELGE
jgi:hypothetical protein